jgi:rhamnose transport system permease protein
MRHIAAGRAVYATGSDPEAARLAGIRPRRVVFGVFVTMGALAGLAALLNAVRFVDVDPNAGAGLELQAIAAVVVGGAAVSGGRGSLAGGFFGVLLLGTIGPALVFVSAEGKKLAVAAGAFARAAGRALEVMGNPQWEKAVQGLVILLAVASDATERRRP